MKIEAFLENQEGVDPRLIDLGNRVLTAINGGIEFGSPQSGTVNINGVWAAGVTPGIADQEFTVTHNLGRVPVGFLPVSVDQSAVIYKGATPWTSKQMFLKCHQTSVTYLIFIF